MLIKINLVQSAITKQTVGNYMSIAQDNKTWYYFILNAVWKSKKTVQLILSLDSVNTFDVEFTSQTQVIREHRSRHTIDKTPEGITPVYYHNPKDDKKILEDGTNNDWFLIYKNHTADTDTALDCFLCATKKVNIKVVSPEGSATIGLVSLSDNHYFYIYKGTVGVAGKKYDVTERDRKSVV